MDPLRHPLSAAPSHLPILLLHLPCPCLKAKVLSYTFVLFCLCHTFPDSIPFPRDTGLLQTHSYWYVSHTHTPHFFFLSVFISWHHPYCQLKISLTALIFVNSLQPKYSFFFFSKYSFFQRPLSCIRTYCVLLPFNGTASRRGLPFLPSHLPPCYPETGKTIKSYLFLQNVLLFTVLCFKRVW